MNALKIIFGFCVVIFYSSCATNAFTDGRAIGKGNVDYAYGGNLIPTDNGVPYYPLQLQYTRGYTNRTDIGVNLGLFNVGFPIKYQLAGSAFSKSALSFMVEPKFFGKDEFLSDKEFIMLNLSTIYSYHNNENGAWYIHPRYAIKKEDSFYQLNLGFMKKKNGRNNVAIEVGVVKQSYGDIYFNVGIAIIKNGKK
jgi:hypothetical protein